MNQPKNDNSKAIIVQYADETKTLPDGSRIIYAENDDKIVLYHKIPFEQGHTYVYDRQNGKISVNGKEGTNKEKRKMLELGTYLIKNSKESEMVTISVNTKEKK